METTINRPETNFWPLNKIVSMEEVISMKTMGQLKFLKE